jgi:alkylation response protein AidB-like acyl-CoA dehydrogenase
MVAAFGLGGGEEAVETALQYAQQRIQAGARWPKSRDLC